MSGRPGVLVIGHGTADPVGAAETRQVAATVASLLPRLAVEIGFLEVIAPTVADAVERLARRGCDAVVAAPLLLFSAGHAKRDVPDAVAAAVQRGMDVRRTDAFGTAAEIVELSRRRRLEAVAGRPAAAAEETALVMIGRGSSDPSAAAQLEEFTAATLAGETPPARVAIGFVAAARPRLDEALAAACDPAAGTVRRVVVQPHLLFRGQVEDDVTAAVDRGRAGWPGVEWIQVARLGADPLVARAVVRLVGRALEPESPARHG